MPKQEKKLTAAKKITGCRPTLYNNRDIRMGPKWGVPPGGTQAPGGTQITAPKHLNGIRFDNRPGD